LWVRARCLNSTLRNNQNTFAAEIITENFYSKVVADFILFLSVISLVSKGKIRISPAAVSESIFSG
jgi:hypothetical protein